MMIPKQNFCFLMEEFEDEGRCDVVFDGEYHHSNVFDYELDYGGDVLEKLSGEVDKIMETEKKRYKESLETFGLPNELDDIILSYILYPDKNLNCIVASKLNGCVHSHIWEF